MRLLPVLLILTSIEAKRRPLENDRVDINRRMKTNDVDVYPERFGEAADFGHVYRTSNQKPMSDQELDMIEPQNVEHARELLRKIGSDYIKMKAPIEPMGFSNPRDKILYDRRYRPKNSDKKIGQNINRHPRINDTLRKLPQTTRELVEKEIKEKYSNQWRDIEKDSPTDIINSRIQPHDDEDHKERYFKRASFELITNEVHRPNNWTTCKEFAKGAVFHPDDVVNIQWEPFFIWSINQRFSISVIHTLSYPTKKLVKKYKEEFGPYLNVRVDWEEPKLLLKQINEILLIAGDRRGLFYGIPYVKLPFPRKESKITIAVMTIRLKIMDPYLAYMYCNDNYATIMSVAGKGPETDEEKTAEAAFLKFKGDGTPVSRDLEIEARKAKFQIESKRQEEENKYIKVERPLDTLHPSLW